MQTLIMLKATTQTFFSLHWDESVLGRCPSWNEPWHFRGTLTGNKSQGVYALLDEKQQVLYVGVGASLGQGRYKGHGLGSRISAYRRVAPNQSGVPVKERLYMPVTKWSERKVSSIATLEFSDKYAYLAYALEALLIRELLPPENIQNPMGSDV